MSPCLSKTAVGWRMILSFLLSSGALLAAEEDPPGQDYVLKVWDADNGLAEASVTDVAETPEGYLWIGTLFGSVLRFDGAHFASFNSANTPEFSSKWGGSRLMVDRQGRLWVSLYDGGLIAWDKEGFHSASTGRNHPERLLWSDPAKILFTDAAQNVLRGQLSKGGRWGWETTPLAESLPKAQPFADAEGRVWYLRKDRNIGIWENGQIKTLTLPSEMQGQRVAGLAATARGHIWVGTDHLLAEWRENRFEVMSPTNGEPVLNVKTIVPSGDDDVWVEANGRMRRCYERQWLAESEGWNREMANINVLRFVHGDAEGGLWSAVGDSGLVHVRADGAFQRLTTRDGLPSNTILFAYQDRSGSTWTGYQRGGLVRVGHRMFRAIGKREGLNDSLINTVCEDSVGGVWIGTHDGGIGRFKNGICTNVFLPGVERMQDSIVTANEKGTLWLAAEGAGLFASDAGRIQQIATPAQLGGYVRLMLPGRDGRLWLATLTSIESVTDGTLATQYAAQTAGDHPTSLAQTADGTVWAGTLSGILLRWDGKEFIRIMTPGQSSLGRIWAMWPAPDGGLWAGAEQGGLLHWRDGQIRRFTTKDGLPSDCVSQIMGDAEGNLWLGTRAGIVRIDQKALAQLDRGELGELPCSVYGQIDGLPTIGSAIMFQPNCWLARDGTVFFAMANSVVAVAPGELHSNPLAPTVVLEELRVDEKPVPLGRSGAILTASELPGDDPRAEPPAVKIGPGSGELEFHFTGLSQGSSSCSRFKYKLEGLENDWNEAGEERKAIYLHVPPAKYVFHVRACNNDGIWNKDGALLVLTLEPHFYQTAWFRIGLGFAAGAGLVFAVVITTRRRMHWRLEQLERQQALDRERTRIAQDLHDELGAGLTEIGLLSGLLQDPLRFAERNPSALERITRRCRDLVLALDEIVWAVNPRNDSVDSLGNYFCLYAQGFFEPSSIRCWLELQEINSPHSFNSEQRHNLFLAFKEALTNVVRHSGASEVHIKIFLEDTKCLVVCVEDNGRGLPTVVRDGSDGLINLRQRMERIGGNCEIANPQNGGVSVRLSLPLIELLENK